MPDEQYDGLLFIGDPHLSSRVPGFRKDNYPDAILAKLVWLLNYAQADRLLPLLLGDLFHWPRDNANWLVVRLMEAAAGRTILGVVGNHDTTMHALQDDDSLAILEAAGRITLVDRTGPWIGRVSGRPVLVGGSTWSSALPTRVDPTSHGAGPETFVVWISHHDIAFAGYESSARYDVREIAGVDLIVNGHIHTPSGSIRTGRTTWLNPGNISRVSRSDAHRSRRPHALRVDLQAATWTSSTVEVPHLRFDDVFYPLETGTGGPEINVSAFVQGLEAVRTLRTASGEGLMDFLDANLQDDDPAVREDIVDLAKEVLSSERS